MKRTHLLTLRLTVLALSFGMFLGSPSAEEPKSKTKEKANLLGKESSPYLLQHAYNPVNWHPWGPEAFEKAKKEKKLVFLSIGYSSCHWCHVMERESFSNKEVAELMNKNFICIKVDREERPDVDEIYMTALSVIGGRGGWPLSMFLTDDGKPIVGGTYWPREDREVDGKKISGFKTVLKTVLETYQDKPKEIREQADEVAKLTAEQLNNATRFTPTIGLTRSLAMESSESMRDDIDPIHGGIGNKERKFKGTKFPMPTTIRNLLEHAYREKDQELTALIQLTLNEMAKGGIYDHLGGGFHRYSTERTWTVPHFEKMLYDNAQLVELYARAYQLDPQPDYKRIIQETLGFIQREMTSPEGGFYSALDADSNGKEGEFYVWTLEEIEKVLDDAKDVALFRAAYSVTREPNFEEKYHILRITRPLSEVAKDQKIDEGELRKKLMVLRTKLLNVRAKRERPFLDTKILTAWNGQMIAGYALAGQVLKEPEYVRAAAKAADLMLQKLRTTDGRLLRTYSTKADGKPEAKLNAYLDDYAFLVHGLLNLYDATSDKKWLDEAKGLTDQMVKWYGDGEKGGFFYTSSDHEKLFARSKEIYDGAQPSANGVATHNLVRLAKLLKDENYRARAERTLKQFAGVLRSSGGSGFGMSTALHLYLDYFPKVAPKPKQDTEPVDTPLKSEEVVKVTAKWSNDDTPEKRKIAVTLSIQEPWHIYGNGFDTETLANSKTVVSVRVNGKTTPVEVTYPKGKSVKDTENGDYEIYEGELSIAVIVPLDKNGTGPIELFVKVQACRGSALEGKCLKPSTIRLMVK